jgi:hypothetical protein
MPSEVHNGHAKGRAVPALPSHTFQDTGITVRLRKLSPMTNQRLSEAIRREFPPPEPPTYEVEYGDQKVREINDADPTYVARYQRWEQDAARIFNERLLKLVCLDAVEVEIGETERTEIERKKRSLSRVGAAWEDDPTLDEDENLRYFYVQHCCFGSGDDMRELYAAVNMRSQPTEAAVQAHIETFSGDA